MPGITEASTALKVGLVLSPLALILTIVGMASPHWIDDKKSGLGWSGLWVTCGKTQAGTICTSYSSLVKLAPDAYPDFLKATQAMEVLGVIVGTAATVLTFLCAFAEYVGRNRFAHFLAMLANLAAAGFVLLGAIIYGAKLAELFPHDSEVKLVDYLSWAFALCVVGGVGFLATGLILILNLRQRWYM